MNVVLQTVVEADPTRVYGVGVGVFCLVFFTTLAIVLCLIGFAVGRRLLFCLTGTIIWLVVVTILFGAEKSAQYIIVEDTLQEYNTELVVRSVYVSILGCGILCSIRCLMKTISEDIQADIIEDIETRRKRHFL